jgi:hypothetical protein
MGNQTITTDPVVRVAAGMVICVISLELIFLLCTGFGIEQSVTKKIINLWLILGGIAVFFYGVNCCKKVTHDEEPISIPRKEWF